MRMGTHAEKEYFLRASPWYDEVVLNANLVEATSGASSAFLAALNKPYMIDPVTYAFGQSTHYLVNPRRGEVKKTFRALADRYGAPIDRALREGRGVGLQDLAGESPSVDFCSRVLAYQRSRLAEALEANEAFLEPGTLEMPPSRLIAPYFFNDRTLAWLDTNVRLAEQSMSLSDGNEEVWTVVSLDGLLLAEREQLEKVGEAYGSAGYPGFLLWPSAFDETRATLGQMVGLRYLVERLSAGGSSGVMFYGGYFSALLRDSGIMGISHGVGYGEKRDVVPVVGGGLPPAKYYLKSIHDDIYIQELLAIMEGMDEGTFSREICSCTICRGLIDRGGLDAIRNEFGATEERPYGRGFRMVPTARVYRLTRFHYIESKHRELAEIAASERSQLLAQLQEAYRNYADSFGYPRLGYLLRWREALAGPQTAVI